MKRELSSDLKGLRDLKVEETEYTPRSPWIRVERDRQLLYVKKGVVAANEGEWFEIDIGNARLPATALWPEPSRFLEHPAYFNTIIATIDTHLLKLKASKSTHRVVAATVSNIVKLIEFSVLNGFYQLNDIPESIWKELRTDLSKGGWAQALAVERRATVLLKSIECLDAFVGQGHSSEKKWSLKSSFLDLLGTNINLQETNAIKHLFRQAQVKPRLAARGNLKAYDRYKLKKQSASSLRQILNGINQVADAPSPWGMKTVPTLDPWKYANKFGRPNGRTENFDPSVLAKLLTHSYVWVYEYGPRIATFVEALGVHMALLLKSETVTASGQPMNKYQLNSATTKILKNLGEKGDLENAIGKKITSYRLRKFNDSTTSVVDLLDELHSACFCILAVMNAKRKDEISHAGIGLHQGSLRILDASLGIYECDFYIEKGAKDYIPFLVNDVTKFVIDLLTKISSIAWDWANAKDPKFSVTGKDRKLFKSPNFLPAHSGVPGQFNFNTNHTGKSNGFLLRAIGEEALSIRVTPHMFRRAYATVYHYRYENADLIALAQRFGHHDVKAAMTYITDGSETPVGKTLHAKWSAPGEVILREQIKHVEELKKDINEVGELRFRSFIEDVISNSGRFAGGFARLVGRFHSRLSGRFDYSTVDSDKQTGALADALIARGHTSEPLKHATCMAGAVRRGAACSKSDGAVQRQLASPEVCCACPYSVMVEGHLLSLKREEAAMSARANSTETILGHQEQMSLQALRRVIVLQSERLGLK